MIMIIVITMNVEEDSNCSVRILRLKSFNSFIIIYKTVVQ